MDVLYGLQRVCQLERAKSQTQVLGELEMSRNLGRGLPTCAHPNVQALSQVKVAEGTLLTQPSHSGAASKL
jgi:hypothetical protein